MNVRLCGFASGIVLLVVQSSGRLQTRRVHSANIHKPFYLSDLPGNRAGSRLLVLFPHEPFAEGLQQRAPRVWEEGMRKPAVKCDCHGGH